MKQFAGKWVQISQLNVEELLQKQNLSWIKRKIILSLTPTIIFSFPEKNILRIEYQTSVKNMTQDYNFPGKTQHKGICINGITNHYVKYQLEGHYVVL